MRKSRNRSQIVTGWIDDLISLFKNKKPLKNVTEKGTMAPNMSTINKNESLSATLFGKTRRAVLALLYSHVDESFYLRQIVRAAGVGMGAVQR